jgi:hypothetical protein
MNKPTIVNSRIRLILITFAFLSLLVINITNIDFTNLKLGIDLTIPIFILLYLVYYFFMTKGYNIYCINDNDFRDSILNSLDKNGIKYKEKMNVIELIDLNNHINIAYVSWSGSGVLKLKNRKDSKIFKKIITDIRNYYRTNNIITNKKLGVFMLLFGIALIILTIIFTYYLLKYGWNVA